MKKGKTGGSNRLHLDFKIEGTCEREEYVKAYLSKGTAAEYESSNMLSAYVTKYNKKNEPFPFPYAPTETELETMANYILYGKTKSSANFDTRDKKGNDGNQNLVKSGYIEIKPRRSTWSKKEAESLDGIREASAETGNPFESQHGLVGNLSGKTKDKVSTRIPKANFSREECRAELLGKNDFLLNQYEMLWQDIDKLEYFITHYEIRMGRRTLDIRQELIDRVSPEERERLHELAKHTSLYDWSKKRSLLVELRQQQYTLRDSYKPTLLSLTTPSYFDEGVLPHFKEVLPCGMKNNNTFFMKEVDESKHFTKTYQRALIRFIIDRDAKMLREDEPGVFDFRKVEHIALLIYAKTGLEGMDIDDLADREELTQFLNTLTYYVESAKLEKMHRDIIHMKELDYQNKVIAEQINAKYGKTYSANYISTIFHSKCCEAIAQSARDHWKILEKISLGVEEFKRCNTCGLLLVRDAENFVRKARASDGLAGRCKTCDKKARASQKKK